MAIVSEISKATTTANVTRSSRSIVMIVMMLSTSSSCPLSYKRREVMLQLWLLSGKTACHSRISLGSLNACYKFFCLLIFLLFATITLRRLKPFIAWSIRRGWDRSRLTNLNLLSWSPTLPWSLHWTLLCTKSFYHCIYLSRHSSLCYYIICPSKLAFLPFVPLFFIIRLVWFSTTFLLRRRLNWRRDVCELS